ncbi:hypothetical protein SmJEL517_g02362 [Synchytrium microbalum]|uniref:Uncharacterized protein n=1 Tax=Synchytrium microbalum TaxID=1806994 RepID=A0A507CBP6_9FUNG|nr:uncharacterized protein SmJEL517_g02362 [Synchytrium microbalum]TPX35374.1 hypothetical protein SmJEL517_g02362 [Synchytrium microbalum]
MTRSTSKEAIKDLNKLIPLIGHDDKKAQLDEILVSKPIQFTHNLQSKHHLTSNERGILCLLEALNDIHQSADASGDDLGLRDRNTILQAVQLCVEFGLSSDPSQELESRSLTVLTQWTMCSPETLVAHTVIQHHLSTLYASYLKMMVTHPNLNIDKFESLFETQTSARSMTALGSIMSSNTNANIHKLAGQYMSRVLIRPNGMKTVFDFLLDISDDDDEPAENEDRTGMGESRLESLAKVVLTVPSQMESAVAYFKLICPQLISIATSQVKFRAQAASYLLALLLEKRPKLSEKLVMKPILEPLVRLNHSMPLLDLGFDLDGRHVLADEASIELCIKRLQNLLAASSLVAGDRIMTSMSQAIPALYYLHQYVTQTPLSSLNKPVLEVLTVFFNGAPSEHSQSELHRIAFDFADNVNAVFAPGPSAGVWIVQDDDGITFDKDVFVQLLQKMNVVPVAATFFLSLLEMYTGLDVAEVAGAKKTTTLLSLIASIMDAFREDLLLKSSTSKTTISANTLRFAKSMLSNTSDTELVSMGLALLMSLLAGQGSDAIVLDGKTAGELLVLLRTVYNQHPLDSDLVTDEDGETKKEIRNMITELRLLILAKREIDVQASLMAESSSEAVFVEAMQEIRNDLIPLRARGMNLLRHLILSRDSVGDIKFDIIAGVFLDFLSHDDSFLYLNAIKGISALTDVYPNRSLVFMMKRYQAENTYTLHYRLRMGEAILQTIQRMGDVFPKYGSEILHGILLVLHDEQAEMRSSAISLIGQIGETCSWGLLPFIYQILDYFSNALRIEARVETRRGVVFALRGLLIGVVQSRFGGIELDVSQRVLNELKLVSLNDQDELTKGHALHILKEMKEYGPI